jgi:hypothetical protein
VNETIAGFKTLTSWLKEGAAVMSHRKLPAANQEEADAMKRFIKTLVQDYGWIHTTIGAIGNFVFFIGSIFFLPSFHGWLTTGVWLFISGSLLMMFGAVGDIFVRIYEAEERRATRDMVRRMGG